MTGLRPTAPARTLLVVMPLNLTVPAYNLACVLCSGFEGGINYWGHFVQSTHVKPPEGEDVDLTRYYQTLLPDGLIGVWDTEESKAHRIELADILRAIQVIAEKYPHHIGDVIAGEGDATTGDVLIQCAIFGEVRYG